MRTTSRPRPWSLYEAGDVTKNDMQAALKKYDIDGEKPNPRLV